MMPPMMPPRAAPMGPFGPIGAGISGGPMDQMGVPPMNAGGLGGPNLPEMQAYNSFMNSFPLPSFPSGTNAPNVRPPPGFMPGPPPGFMPGPPPGFMPGPINPMWGGLPSFPKAPEAQAAQR